MAPTKYCPVCSVSNKKNKLIPRQINFRLAVYLCENNSCPYPEGYNLVDVEQRSLNEIFHKQKEPLHDESDLDTWLKDFFADEDSRQSMQSNVQTEDGNINDDDLSKIINEISNVHNENELDLQYDTDIFAWIDNAFETHDAENYEVQNKKEVEKCDVGNIASNFSSIQLQVNDSNAVVGSESVANVNLENKSPVDNDNHSKLEATKTAVINENKSKLLVTNCDTKDNTVSKPPSVPYRILNFEQFRTPIGDVTGIQCSFKKKCDVNSKVEPIKDKCLTNNITQASSQKYINRSKAEPNFAIFAKVEGSMSEEESKQSKQNTVKDKFKDFNYTSIVIKPNNVL